METRIYDAAIQRWGAATQIAMFAEECAEASAAATRYLFRDRGTLAEEVADVEIMCAQMRRILGNDPVDEHKRAKLRRLQERLAALDASNESEWDDDE